MAKFDISLTALCEYRMRIEAEDEEAAIDAAFRMKPQDVCPQDAGWGQPWTFNVPDDDACWEVADLIEIEERSKWTPSACARPGQQSSRARACA